MYICSVKLKEIQNMPILNKTFESIVNNELINYDKNNRKMIIVLCEPLNNDAVVILTDGKVRNNFELGKIMDKWDDACRKYANVPFKLCMRIDEVDEEGIHFNPLGVNVSLKVNKS